jgi:hypothetical protein
MHSVVRLIDFFNHMSNETRLKSVYALNYFTFIKMIYQLCVWYTHQTIKNISDTN